MMSDRFDAQLRQHLLETADARPADGQLASVVQNVARTPQRSRLVAGLTWFPGRIGPFPARTVRYGLVALAVIAATVTAAILVGGGQPRRSTVFEGTWTSTDPGDGSAQSLIVGLGATPAVRFVDAYATGAACVSDVVKVFTADGAGLLVAGDRLEVTFPDGGGCGSTTAQVTIGFLDYQQATDSLVDRAKLTWTRADELVPPTRGPSASDSAVPAGTDGQPRPSVGESCTGFDTASTYSRTVDKVSVSLRVPAAADDPWSGSGFEFALAHAPCGSSGSPRIEINFRDAVYADACHWASVEPSRVSSAAEARSMLLAQGGHSSTATTTAAGTPGEDPGVIFTIAPILNPEECDRGGIALWPEFGVDPGGVFEVWPLDIDGRVLFVSASFRSDEPAEQMLALIDQVLATLEVGN